MKRARYLLVLVTTLLAAPAFPGAASAHVEMTPSKAKAGKPVDLSFEIPHGCDGAATTSLVVQIPGPAKEVTAAKINGWKATSGPRTLTWTGGPLPDHETLRVPFRATLYGKKGDTVMFKVIQKCQGGASTAWIQPTSGDTEPEHPAPAVTLTSTAQAPAAEGPDTEGQSTATAADSDDSSNDDDGGSGKTLLLIVIAGLAIGTVAGIVVRARRQ